MALPSFRVLSLFSGIGGLDLAVRLAVPSARTVCFVEREVYAFRILAARMEEGSIHPAPICMDVREFNAHSHSGLQDQQATGAVSPSGRIPPSERRYLNPIFVAWLMGLPICWSSPEPIDPINFERWETQFRQLAARWHSYFLRQEREFSEKLSRGSDAA